MVPPPLWMVTRSRLVLTLQVASPGGFDCTNTARSSLRITRGLRVFDSKGFGEVPSVELCAPRLGIEMITGPNKPELAVGALGAADAKTPTGSVVAPSVVGDSGILAGRSDRTGSEVGLSAVTASVVSGTSYGVPTGVGTGAGSSAGWAAWDRGSTMSGSAARS